MVGGQVEAAVGVGEEEGVEGAEETGGCGTAGRGPGPVGVGGEQPGRRRHLDQLGLDGGPLPAGGGRAQSRPGGEVGHRRRPECAQVAPGQLAGLEATSSADRRADPVVEQDVPLAGDDAQHALDRGPGDDVDGGLSRRVHPVGREPVLHLLAGERTLRGQGVGDDPHRPVSDRPRDPQLLGPLRRPQEGRPEERQQPPDVLRPVEVAGAP